MLRDKSFLLYALLLVLTLAVYGRVGNNDFVDFDDELHIRNNAQVTSGLSWSGFLWDWTTFHGNYWQPVTWLSLQADAEFFSERPSQGEPMLSPAAFHIHSLLWHAASVLLLFALWQRLTGASWRSFFLAALFAVHPMHVESVAWAVERKDVLSAFFGILTVFAYVRYLEAPGWKRYLGVVGAFAMSLLSKPMLMTLPFVLLLLDYWPLGRFGRRDAKDERDLFPRPASTSRLMREKLPLFLMAAAVAIVTVLAREQAGAPAPLSQISLSARVANALSAYGHYLAGSLWPFGLAALYPHARDNWSTFWVLAGATALITITAISIRQMRRRPWLITGWLWFVGTLLPVIGLAQGGAQAWADRFSYWPHIGLFLVLVWGLGELVSRLQLPARAVAALGTLTLGCLGALTWIQVGYWRDTVTLWERALAVTDDKSHAHIHLGKHYLDQGRLDLANGHFADAVKAVPDSADYHFFLGEVLLMLGRTDEAAEQFRETLRRKLDYIDAWYNLGVNELRRGKLDRALRCFRKVLEFQPGAADALSSMGLALLQEGKRHEAVESLQAAVRVNPRDVQALSGLGYACLARRQTDEAIAYFSNALRVNPHAAKAASGLGVALARQGNWTAAVSCQRLAIRHAEQAATVIKSMGGIAPGHDQAIFRCRLGFALHQSGYTQAAAAEYAAALKDDPDWPRRFTADAWKLVADPDPSHRDPQLGLELATQATQAVDDPPASTLAALAATQAALGDYRAAIQTAQKALAKIPACHTSSFVRAVLDQLQR